MNLWPPPHNDHSTQLTLFETANHPLLDTIRTTDLNNLTPLEVQQLVAQWQEQLTGSLQGKPR